MEDRLSVSKPEVCSVCNGSGFVYELNIMAAKRNKKRCENCDGTGVKDGKMTGIRTYRPHSQVWQYLEKGVVLGTLEVWQHCDNQGSNYLEIHKMITKRKHRNRGVMTTLFLSVFKHPYILWIETSYTDSTEAGREWLMKRGFKREGDKLISRRRGVTNSADGKTN